MLSDEDMKDIPVAVLVNKIDVHGAAGAEELISQFGIYGLSTGKVLSYICTALNRAGSHKYSLAWLEVQVAKPET